MDLHSHLIDRVEQYMRERVDLFFSKMDNMIEATWLGMEGRRGKCKLSSDGSIHTGRVNKDAKSAKSGDKCWWDGKTIYLEPSVRRIEKKERKRKPGKASEVVKETNTELTPEEAPFTFFAQAGTSWRTTFSGQAGSWFLSTPSGVIPCPDVGWFDEMWPKAKEQMLAGNFWLTSYPAPTDYTGFYTDVNGQYYGTVASNWTDNTFIYPYVHQYQIDYAKDLSLAIAFSTGQDTTSLGPVATTFQYWYRSERIEDFDIQTMVAASNGFIGAGRNNNRAMLLNSQAPERILFKVGDKVTLDPEWACVANRTNPCFNGTQGWNPYAYVAYSDPFGGAACLPGCELTITAAPRRVLSGDPVYGGYVGFTVIEGTPTPAVSDGNPFGFGAQYGRLVATLTDQSFGPNPSKEQLISHWNTYAPQALYAPQEGGDWVVEDLSGNEPPLPPINYGYTQDVFHDAGGWWYTSSRDGVFYGYDVFMVWEWKDGMTWPEALGSVAANPKYKGTLGEGSTTLCRWLTESALMPGGQIEDPIQPYRQPLIITRVRVDTNTQQVDWETFEWVETPGCAGPETNCGYWSPGFEDVMLEHAWPDDPRVLDGLDFNIADEYHYDDITGWLWEVRHETNDDIPGGNNPNNSNRKFVGKYWSKPDDTEVGTQAFYDWVDDALHGNLAEDGEYEWPAVSKTALDAFKNEAGEDFYDQAAMPVLRKAPKRDVNA